MQQSEGTGLGYCQVDYDYDYDYDYYNEDDYTIETYFYTFAVFEGSH